MKTNQRLGAFQAPAYNIGGKQMIKVYHGYHDDRKLLGEFETLADANKCMNDYLKEIKFNSYYSRMWKEPDGATVVDYGSHTQFFWVEGAE